MEIINAYGFISSFLFIFVIIIFFWTLLALALEKTVTKKKKPKILVLPVTLLFSTVILMLSGNMIVKHQFIKLSESQNITVHISPEISINQKHLYNYVMSNIYSFKGLSGSQPTSNKYILRVCEKNENPCAIIELGQDSREKSMYWVQFKPSSGTYIPLGYVKLGKEMSEVKKLSQYNKALQLTSKSGARHAFGGQLVSGT